MIDRTKQLVLMVLPAPVLLFADGAMAAAAEDSPGLFTGNLGNIIWTLITFLAVVFVLGKFAWGPILRALQKREEFIGDSLRQAKEDREQAQAQLKEYTEQLDKARADASAIVDEGRRDAEVVKRRISNEARAEADAMLERAKREIATARDSAVKELYQLTAKLSTEVAARVIRAELDSKAHERLIEESIEELARLRESRDN
ncbi:MAG: F0F1 ATP synthase subunit B [Phycisphaerales bacterium]|nr:MAG: F0F1 ATP synthase subunit B [Phycisphaerales bacterium]